MNVDSTTVEVARPPRSRLFNRELSWLAFNARVLALACEPSTPLFERVSFVSIFASNFDEFFQVRVAGLKDQVEAGITQPAPDGRTPAERRLLQVRRADGSVFWRFR